ALYRARDSASYLLLCAHHLVCDAGSLRLLLEELSIAYRNVGEGGLPPIAGSYAAYAAGECAGEHPGAQDDVAYWLERLRDAPVLDLPTDRRPVERTFAAGTVEVRIGEGLAGALENMARSAGVTTFTVLL